MTDTDAEVRVARKFDEGGEEVGAGDGAASAGPAPTHAEGPETARDRRDRLAGRLALALALAPFVVAAVWLVVAVGGEYHSASDHALTEMQTRHVGRRPVLVGLYSRDEWNHPGPALFYVLAPFYWLTGGLSVGISVGALAINGGAVAGMGLLARRRGGTPLMLVTLLGCALLMRMLGADFLRDPWNCFVTTLPFGLLVFLAWTLWAGEAWALPVAAAVATFLAQSHVGFVPLALPLLAWGVVGLVVAVAREADGDAQRDARRRGMRAAVVAAAVLAVAWLPTLVEIVRYSPSNVRSIWDWFRDPANEPHTLGEGWRVMAAQFGGAPEWLTAKNDFDFAGETPYLHDSPLPWLLAVLAVAGVVLWRHRTPGVGTLLATLAVTFSIGVVAVARTVGPAFDYRLRWTYIPGLVGLVVVGWAAWTLAADRWTGAGRRVLPAVALAGLGVVAAVNVVTAARAGVPQHDDSVAVAAITQQVMDSLPEAAGTVLVTDAHHSGAWHARGLVLQLERRGIDVAVPTSLADEYGRWRTHAGFDGVGTVLVVTTNDWVDDIAGQPGMRMIAEWETVPADERHELLAERERALDNTMAGSLGVGEAFAHVQDIDDVLFGDGAAAWRVAVFVDTATLAESGG